MNYRTKYKTLQPKKASGVDGILNEIRIPIDYI
jgi:hypothetical protein